VVQTAVVQTMFVGFSADGKHLVSTHATDEGELVNTRIWEIESGLEVQRFDEYCVGLTKDRRAALLFNLDRLARLVTIPEGIEKRRMQLDRRSWPVSASPDADALLVRRDRGGGLAWIDFATGAERPVAIDSSFRIGPLSPASGVLLATDRDSKAVALDAASGQVWTRFDSGAGRISQFAFSPDGRLAAGCTVNHLPGGGTPAEGEPRLGWVYVWDVATGGLVQKLDYEAGEPAMLVFTPDSLGVLGPGRDGVARLWDLRTGGLMGRYETGGYTLAAGFSADGRTLATSPQSRTSDDAIQLWDVATGTRAQRLEGLAEGAVSASFEAKGRLLAVLGRGVRFWDLERGEETRRFAGAELVRDRGRPRSPPTAASWLRPVGASACSTSPREGRLADRGPGRSGRGLSADGRLRRRVRAGPLSFEPIHLRCFAPSLPTSMSSAPTPSRRWSFRRTAASS
jgi:WD40 repeat protein